MFVVHLPAVQANAIWGYCKLKFFSSALGSVCQKTLTARLVNKSLIFLIWITFHFKWCLCKRWDFFQAYLVARKKSIFNENLAFGDVICCTVYQIATCIILLVLYVFFSSKLAQYLHWMIVTVWKTQFWSILLHSPYLRVTSEPIEQSNT